MRKMIDYGDYILGKKFTDVATKQYRMTADDLKELKRLLIIHPTAAQNITAINSPKLFYTKEPDMKNDIEPAKREEYFYTAKLGRACLHVPAKLVYFVELAIKEYGSPNYFMFLMQEKDLEEIFSKDYLSAGYTVRDVIVSLTSNHSYMPLREGSYKSITGDNQVDLYIEEEDSIAMVPSELSKSLSYSDIKQISIVAGQLCISGKPISQLGNYIGIGGSTYDLRSII